MKRSRTLVTLGATSALVLTLAACGGEQPTGGTPDATPDGSASAPSEMPMETPSESPSDDAMGGDTDMDPAANLVGPGCEDYAAQVPDGAGSVSGMAQDTVTVAASNNPLLTQLTAAVSGQLNPDVDLTGDLDAASGITVFAPVDDAFAALDPATLKLLQTPEGADTLASVLTYHVVGETVDPSAPDGTYTTLEGQDLTVSGSGDSITVESGAETPANVICGGVQTANATVYLIDGVLMPPAA